MIIELLALLTLDAAEPTAQVPPTMATESAPTVIVEKEIIYQKDQVVDLTGSTVEGADQLPPAFFVTKNQTPRAKSLLDERLRFHLRDFNLMGF